ncbi:unnamed protein product [Rotaria sp. Silwood2]|nr:unnamed protein product [Rotaria sp. Silwood2]CAF2674528.1 unnamed protein product [Rotaria sp. Silwood2]CAF2928594.1 unnamed protein product [Rotaria sp. Silwood2]CAF3082596.1 unnamed protein product [Rotaria sp. Silwood2]CAF3938457.1 unnamed protein product [Rotaria sp. Silwood2]
MSVYIDHIKNDKDLPITYSINIKTLSPSKRPLTCCITTEPQISKQHTTSQLNYIKSSSKYLEEKQNSHIKLLDNDHESSIRLPITYSTSIHVPYHSPIIASRPPTILPSETTHHHYHYYYHHHRQSRLLSDSSTIIKHKISPRPISNSSTRLATTPTSSTTTRNTSPDSLSLSKKANKINHSTLPNSISVPRSKQSSHNLPFSSYSTLVRNWFHHTPIKTQTYRKGNQSDYSETYRHESPNKRNFLFKLITSSIEKNSKSKHHHRTCFCRKRFQSSSSSSSSSLPNNLNNYKK